MKLDKGIKEKRLELATRKGVIFHQDNARSLLESEWEVMFLFF